MNDHVAVLIVGYRCAREIRVCLEALSRSTHGAFEVHVCENGGAEAFRQLAEEIASSEVLSDARAEPGSTHPILETRIARFASGQALHLHRAGGNLGYAGGLNALMRHIAPDNRWSSIWVLNPDTEAEPDALRQLVAYARTGPYGIIGSRLILAETGTVQLYGGRWRKWMARGFNIGLGQPRNATPDTPVERDMDYVSGAAMFVTRDYIETVGRMDERYFLYAEEVDWCFRRGEFRLGYAHDAVVLHSHGATMGSSHDKRQRSALSVYLDERNKLLFTRRFFPAEYPVVLVVTLLLTSQYLVAGAHRNFVTALKGWFAGLLGREGPPHWLLPAAEPASLPVAGSGPAPVEQARPSVSG
jgi:GT2 family glycosyltransferase